MTSTAAESRTPEGRPERNQSASLRRALAVLEHVRDHAAAGTDLSLTALADGLEMSKSTVLRLAAPLVDAQLLARDRDSGHFRLGPGALRLGQAYLATLDLRTAASEEAHQLMREVGGTVHLCVPDAPYVVYVDKVENETAVRMASRIGSRAPMYCTAVGKAMLAWMPEDAFATVVADGLPAITTRTLTSAAALRTELTRIRTRGYAVDDRENEPEVRCIAAPVFDHNNTVIGAISTSALTSRITAARARELGPVVAATAARVSRTMGSTR
ncbi:MULTISPECIES: IclR family transcriptional regulator [Kitasatospora]|uniref:IclR family transcriptional regulator n=1 Tax=Kitasatospora TaxID=2063 RepID=UPI002283E816|nr:IclR family transcriptional regulator [Kitasatospora sp. YST-16]WAL71169.1 IclR family transcriptional regulator [Kitasatospora sp. YST-16]WNW37206.1 IclR family transcriptional regulator [Streptomyces sp. Li-HN-5-13]